MDNFEDKYLSTVERDMLFNCLIHAKNRYHLEGRYYEVALIESLCRKFRYDTILKLAYNDGFCHGSLSIFD